MGVVTETYETTIVSVDPATLERVGSVPVSAPNNLDQAVETARDAARVWARQPLTARSRLLRSIGVALLEASDEVSTAIVAESGKPRLEALTADVFVALDVSRWLARNAARLLADERLPMRQPYLAHKRARLRYEPCGVVGIVSPWNFPLGVPFTQALTAIAAGNAVVLKPSELTPLTGAWIEELLRRAGAPEGLVSVVQGTGGIVGARLVSHPGVDHLLFTGSTTTGRAVAAAAAERLLPAVLELGGKDPMLVLDDADLGRAVEGALWGAFTNCGQVCSGIERIYVAASCHDAFVERLVTRTRQLRIGHGMKDGVDLGPLISEARRTEVEALVADAVQAGATIATGGARPETGLPGWFHEPTILLGEPERARLRDEEIFGPVVTVVSVEDEEDGIARANASPFGLGASVWSRDARRAHRVASAIEAGSVWTNDHAYSYGACQAPWGGTKASGHGRTHSKHGLYAMSQVKFLDSDSGRLRPPWWYPYGARATDGFRGALTTLYSQGMAARARSAARHRRELVALGRRMFKP